MHGSLPEQHEESKVAEGPDLARGAVAHAQYVLWGLLSLPAAAVSVLRMTGQLRLCTTRKVLLQHYQWHYCYQQLSAQSTGKVSGEETVLRENLSIDQSTNTHHKLPRQVLLPQNQPEVH